MTKTTGEATGEASACSAHNTSLIGWNSTRLFLCQLERIILGGEKFRVVASTNRGDSIVALYHRSRQWAPRALVFKGDTLAPLRGIRNLSREKRELIWQDLKHLRAGKLDHFEALGRKSGQCCLCGRYLSDPESISRGVGPICAQKFLGAFGPLSSQKSLLDIITMEHSND